MERVNAVVGRIARLGGLLALSITLAPAAQAAPDLKVPSPMAFAGIPNFDLLWKNYPRGTHDEVKARIGGAVNAAWVTNTSAIRMSRAWNLSGTPIPAGPANAAVGMHTVLGADKQHYAYRAAEFHTWLRSKYGPPTFVAKGPGQGPPASMAGKAGIILFQDCGWSDATGHFDLWDGKAVAGSAYFDKCKEVALWVPKPVTAAGAVARTAVVAAATNVRSGPSTASPIVGQLAKDTVVTLTGTTVTNNFWQIGPNQYVNAAQLRLQ